MKILLDENLPRKLKFDFGGNNQVFTVSEFEWSGKKNGELLKLATNNGFDVFITVDKNLKYQQNLTKSPLTIFVLYAKDNKRKTLKPLIAEVERHLTPNLQKGLIEIKP